MSDEIAVDETIMAYKPAGADWALVQAVSFIDQWVSFAGEISVHYWNGRIWQDRFALALAKLLHDTVAAERERCAAIAHAYKGRSVPSEKREWNDQARAYYDGKAVAADDIYWRILGRGGEG